MWRGKMAVIGGRVLVMIFSLIRYLAAMNNEPRTEDAVIGKATIAGIIKSVVSCLGGKHISNEGDREYLRRLLQERRESLSNCCSCLKHI